MSRKTQDGQFLTQLVRLGLLKVAEEGEEPFASSYVLSDLGKHAGEFGEFELAWDEYKKLMNKNPSGSATLAIPAGEEQPAPSTPRPGRRSRK